MQEQHPLLVIRGFDKVVKKIRVEVGQMFPWREIADGVHLMAQLGAEQSSPLTVKDQLLQAVGSALVGTDLKAVMEQAQAAVWVRALVR